MSDVVQYGRVLSVVVSTDAGEGIEFQDFRCVFDVVRGDYQNPNTCDLRIYNLSNDTAKTIRQEEFTTLTVQAGYPGNVGQIFKGTTTQTRKGQHDQRDNWVDITAADGDKAYNFATVSQSLPAGSEAASVVSVLYFAMNRFDSTVTLAQQPQFSKNGCIRGRVLYGLARDEARDFSIANGCSWSIQDGALTMIPLQSYIPSNEVPVIGPQTGLIGVPEQTSIGLRIRTLLNPALKIGQRIKLDSADVNQFRYIPSPGAVKDNTALKLQIDLSSDGDYYVMAANHRGDTRGNEWYTDLTCLSINATVTNNFTANALFAIGPGQNDDGTIKRY